MGDSRDAMRRRPVAEVLVASICFAIALAIFLAGRRVAGALVDPLPLATLLVTASLTLAWAWCMRVIGTRVLTSGPLRSLASWAPLVVLLLIAVACSYPSHRTIDWIAWAVAAAAVWFAPVQPNSDSSPIAGEPRSPESAAEVPPGEILQQLTRVRLAEGREAVQGTLVAEFAAGQDVATLYVGFCPPFEFLPQVEAEVADGPAAKIKIVQVLHNGARLDVGLSRPAATPMRVSVELSAAEQEEMSS